MEDKILTLSNAMIEKADYGEAKSVGDGLFEVPVTAVVKKGRLNQELKAVGIATGAVKGDSLAATLFTGKERVANAEKFFVERFKEFPQNVMEGVMLTKADGSPDIEVDTDSGHIFANVAFLKQTNTICRSKTTSMVFLRLKESRMPLSSPRRKNRSGLHGRFPSTA